MEDIFIQISSYHDYELPNTIKSALKNASGQYQINIGVHHIYHKKDDIELPDLPNVKIIKSKAPKNLGMGIGRKIAHSLYNNETYYMQVDAHTRFNKNWDLSLVNQIKEYKSLGVKKPILTCYPGNYWYEDSGDVTIEQNGTPTIISFNEKPELFKNHRFTSQTAVFNPENNIYTRSVSGGNIFTVGPFIVPNSKILAAGEELVIAARAYTHGYDLVVPKTIEIAHLYYNPSKPETNKRRLAWNDYPKQVAKLDLESQAEIKRIFADAPIDEEGFGTERTLKDFGRFAGLDFTSGEIVDSECCNEKPKVAVEESKKSAWQKYKEKNGSTPFDLLNPNTEKASAELAKSRMDICKSCPELIPVLDQCKRCGCFMALKTTLKVSKCPIGKW